ncbi:hypothetical protein V1514DRAFT_367953 [Lipomyces japonicus]|uniref:uncharacterized protein n=1 Tax=Lipomyces japonicus TaxID=56871 RepID=UPI0034D01584
MSTSAQASSQPPVPRRTSISKDLLTGIPKIEDLVGSSENSIKKREPPVEEASDQESKRVCIDDEQNIAKRTTIATGTDVISSTGEQLMLPNNQQSQLQPQQQLNSPEHDIDFGPLVGGGVDECDDDVPEDFEWLDNLVANAPGMCDKSNEQERLTPPYDGSNQRTPTMTASAAAPGEVEAPLPTPPATASQLPSPAAKPMLIKEVEKVSVPGITFNVSKNISEVKSRIINTHSLMTTYAAMKSAYTQVCALSKSLTTQLATTKKSISELEKKNVQLAVLAKARGKKIEELTGIIKSLPDQGEILRSINELEAEVAAKDKELEALRNMLLGQTAPNDAECVILDT